MRRGWIRRLEGNSPEQLAKIQAQALRGAIWVLYWSYKQHRIFPTRKEAEASLSSWKRWKERHGWRVWGYGGSTYAGPPDEIMSREVCHIRKYDSRTLEEL